MSRLLVGNLDCEKSWEGQWYQRPAALAVALQKKLSLLATVWQVFAQEGDWLWLPQPINWQRVVPFAGRCLPQYGCGQEGFPDKEIAKVVAWGNTWQVERLREKYSAFSSGCCSSHEAAQVNHRYFAWSLAQQLEIALPYSKFVYNYQEFMDHLAQAPFLTNKEQAAWVLKSPFSAAGRSHILGAGVEISEKLQQQIRKRFRQEEGLLFEPWMPRVADFGCCAQADAGRVTPVSWHKLTVDKRGRFQAVTVPVRAEQMSWLSPHERKISEETLEAVGDKIQECGYQGVFGIDMWRYHQANGEIAYQPLGEINARMSFGVVARKIADELLAMGEVAQDGLVTLGLGGEKPGEKSFYLVVPEKDDSTSVWVDIQ